MPNAEPINVADMSEFCRLVETGNVTVTWSVSADLGLNSIGSQRLVRFFCNASNIEKGRTTDHLIELLCEGLKIPVASQDHCISGEGDVRRNGTRIEVKYDWYKAIPYQDPCEYGTGVLVLFDTRDTDAV